METETNHLTAFGQKQEIQDLSSISRLIKDHDFSCRFSHCVCFDVGDVLRMYVVQKNTVETNDKYNSAFDWRSFEFTFVHRNKQAYILEYLY